MSVMSIALSSTALVASMTGWLSSPVLVALQAATPATIAASCIGVLGSVLARRRGLSILSLVLLGVWIALVLDVRLSAVPPPVGDHTTLRIVAANLMLDNISPTIAASEVLAEEPDVLVSVETPPASAAVFEAAGLELAASGRGRADRVMIWSRYPFTALPRLDLGDRELPVVEITSPAGTITFVGVHLMSPTTARSLAQWRTNWEHLSPALDTLDSPVVVMGDFNTSVMHEPLRRQLRRFDHTGSASTSSILSPTWPAQPYKWWKQPWQVLDLDHILVDGVAAEDPHRGSIPGSDHLYVAASVAPSSSD